MKNIVVIVLLLLSSVPMLSQRIITDDSNRAADSRNPNMGARGNRGSDKNGSRNKFGKKGNNTEGEEQQEDSPIGIRTWKVTDYNEMDSVQTDTLPHLFQNLNFTEGITGRYNHLGNLGSPRISRVFGDRPQGFDYFIFAQPYDYFLKPFNDFHFTNTLSPITNITYYETTNSDLGEDYISAKYAQNIDKTAGIGFHLNYLYGRGYYHAQNTSQFNATIYGSVVKERYKAHFTLFSNYLKTSENGGITDDEYISNPEKFPSSFETNDIPTRLDRVYNKMYLNGLQLTHSYSMGFYKDKNGKRIIIKKDEVEKDSTVTPLANDSIDKNKIETLLAKTDSKDSLKNNGISDSASLAQRVFVPVTSVIHTLKVNGNTRDFLTYKKDLGFFTNNYLPSDSAQDHIKHINVSNMVALELHEGFNKYMVSGIRLFAKHDFNHYSIPLTSYTNTSFTENRFILGGMLLRREGKVFNYNLLGQTSSDGNNWGEFEIRGKGNLNLLLLGDTVNFEVHGEVINQAPTFFYRHYHGKYLWWENDNLSKQFSTRIGGTLASKKTKTRLSINLENIKNYTYFASTLIPANATNSGTMDTHVAQEDKNIQLMTVSLNQDFRLGILNWENEAVYQKCSNDEVLPLPDFSIYTNLYLLFRIAKVLRVEFGGDMRYFSKYYAPTYNPALAMFTNQDTDNKIKVGDHPIINLYANLHLKHTRFYVMYSHINYSKEGGNVFWAPHYPANPGMLKLGISWNFFN